jgi:hypothetical protein
MHWYNVEQLAQQALFGVPELAFGGHLVCAVGLDR